MLRVEGCAAGSSGYATRVPCQRRRKLVEILRRHLGTTSPDGRPFHHPARSSSGLGLSSSTQGSRGDQVGAEPTIAGLEQLHAVAEAHVGDALVPGLVALVATSEQVHVETLGTLAIGGTMVTRDSIFRIASTTKPITAAATLALVAEALVDLDEPVDRLLPSSPSVRSCAGWTDHSATPRQRPVPSPPGTCSRSPSVSAWP